MKISEIFESIQGEGITNGYPMLFIRLFGCNRQCSYCDTIYAREGKYKEMSVKELVKIIRNTKLDVVLWTGGEPLLQINEIREVISLTRDKKHFLETNGDLLNTEMYYIFDFISCSPKSIETAKKVKGIVDEIKIVTDLGKVGVDLIPYATTLMPLTTFTKKDKIINRKVWEYCVKHNIRFSPRLQILIWGKKKKI